LAGKTGVKAPAHHEQRPPQVATTAEERKLRLTIQPIDWHPADRLVRESEAAEFLRLKPSTLRQWRYKRTGPAFEKIGSRVVYRFSELLRYLDSVRVENAR
jgi:hypothetical protein